MSRTVLLAEERGDDGLMVRSVTLTDDGDLVIEGHDVGRGVGKFFGAESSEYEFVSTVRAADVPAVRRALGLGEDADLLDTLVARYGGQGTAELERIIKGARIAVKRWSRIGD